MIRHPLLMSLSVASLLLGLSACTPGTPKENPTPAPVETASDAPHLGGTLAPWIQKEGAPKEENEYLKTFRNGAVSVIVMENHVVNITFTPTKTQPALPVPDTYLPRDREPLQTKTEEDANFTYKSEYYRSKSLKDAVPLSSGAFSVVTATSKKTGEPASLVIDCSPLSEG